MQGGKGAGIYPQRSTNPQRFLAWYSLEREDKMAPSGTGGRQGSVCEMLGTPWVPEEGKP